MLLKKKQEELKNEDPIVEYRRRLIERFSYKNSKLIKKIYAENRAKAKAAHDKMLHLNYNSQHNKLPLYNQPSDLESYHENNESYKLFRPRLLKFLSMKKICENKIEHYKQQDYEEQRQQWLKKLDRLENNPKRKQRQQRMRQFYEREFPEIKKHREQQERVERLGSRSVGTRSEGDIEEVTNSTEGDTTDKQTRLLAVPMPSLSSTYDRRSKFINTNGLIRNLPAFEKERRSFIIWTEKEKQLFREKFLQFPKDFEKIASFIPSKECSDCVLFYYQNKKKEGFRSSKSKNKKKSKLNRSGTMSLRSLDNKKVTRNSKESSQQEQELLEEEETQDESNASEEEGQPTASLSTAIITESNEEEKTARVPQEKIVETKTEKEQVAISKPKGLIATTLSITEKCTTEADISIKTQTTNVVVTTAPITKPKQQLPVKVFNTRSGKYNHKANPQPKPEKNVAEEVKSTCEVSHPPLKMTIMVTSPSHTNKDNTSVSSVASIISETVTSAGQEQATADVSKGTEETKDVESPSVVVKVDELIRQHHSKMPEHSDPSRWSEQEMMRAVEGLKKYGRSWSHISKIVETKSDAQCKNFYFNYKKKFNLESILGIVKNEDVSDTTVTDQLQEELVLYLKELDEEERLKEKEQVEEDVKESDKEVSQQIFVTEETNQEEKPTLEIPAVKTGETIVQDGEESKTTKQKENTAVSKTDVTENKAHSVSFTSPVTKKETAIAEPPAALRPPPPLVADSQFEKKPSLQEIPAHGDNRFFKQKFQLSVEAEQSKLAEAPPLISTESLKAEEMLKQTQSILSPTRLHPSTNISPNERRFVPEDHGLSQFNFSSEQTAAIQAFNNRRTGYMTSLQTGIVTGELPSPRFRFPVSPNITSNANVRFTQQNTPQKAQFVINPLLQVQRSPIPQTLRPGSISPNSAKRKMGAPAGYGDMRMLQSPRLQGQYPPKQFTLDELQALREREYIHRQNELEHKRAFVGRSEHKSPGLVRPRDMEAEPEANFSHRQKEMQRYHELQRQQQELRHCLNYEKQSKLPDREDIQHLRLRSFDQQKEIELLRKSRIFAENTKQGHQVPPSEPNTVSKMTQEMFLSLQRHFSPFEKLTALDKREMNKDLASPRDLVAAARDMSLEMPHDISPHREEYLRVHPSQPKTLKDFQQRAASIPDLRQAISSPMRENPYLLHERKRTFSGNDPSHWAREASPKPQLQIQQKVAHLKDNQHCTSDRFPLEKPISIQEVPLEPLSRPSSAEADGKLVDKKVYGISTGLARKAVSLTSITGVPTHERNEKYKQEKRNSSPSMQHQSYASSTITRVPNKEIDLPSKRKAAIVRPWEIEGDAGKSNEPPRTGTPQPVIHLAATTNKYKEQIINIAQMNSPAPEAFPKFNFDAEAVKETFKNSAGSSRDIEPFKTTGHPNLRFELPAVNRKTSRSYSDQSLSPTFPMPLRKEDVFERPAEVPARLRSDSEETVSADEVENKEVGFTTSALNLGKSNTLLPPPPIHLKPRVPTAIAQTVPTFHTNTQQTVRATTVQLPMPEEIGTQSGVLQTNQKSFGPVLTDPVVTSTKKVVNISKPNTTTSSLESVQTSASLTPAATHTALTQQQNVPNTILQQNRPEKQSYNDTLQEKMKTIRTSEAKTETVVYSASSSIHLAVVHPSTQTTTTTTTSKVKTVTTIFPEKVEVANSDVISTKQEVVPERAESPDIYDDLKVHDYKEQAPADKEQQPSDINFDLFKRDDEKSNDSLSELTSANICPINDEPFLFGDKDESDTMENEDTNEIAKTAEESSMQSPKPAGEQSKECEPELARLDEPEAGTAHANRKDAGTPVMDEPCGSGESANTDVKVPTIVSSDNLSPNFKNPPLREAKTPLLDEPRYHFDASCSTNKDTLHKEEKPGKRHSKKSQDQFESITPPSSPERKGAQEERSLSTSSTSNATSSIAFPYSALAFNVNSRPGSRGSSVHSGERSPGIEDEISILRKHKKYREPEIDLKNIEYLTTQPQNNDHRRPPKRRYHQSSSSSNFIRSPEFEYHNRMVGRHSPRRSPRKSLDEDRNYSRHSSSNRHYENLSKRKRSSSPDSSGLKHTRP